MIKGLIKLFKVITDHPIAFDSHDHIRPHGTAMDNSRWPMFNEKLYDLFPADQTLFIMDVGCSGGGFVKDCLDDGHQAIGLEGSDYSLLRKRAEWATIPDNLFTCDITYPFRVEYEDEPCLFDVITGWELLEHMPEGRLDTMIDNCINHLKPGGYGIFSVSPNHEYWHVCVHDKAWWLNKFNGHNMVNNEELIKYFGDDWIRGPKQEACNSYHLVLQTKGK